MEWAIELIRRYRDADPRVTGLLERVRVIVVPIVNPDGGGTYGAADEVAFYLQPIPTGVWENTVTVRSTRWSRMYAPGEFIARVSPTPLLIVAADHDNTVLTDLVLSAYERALEPKHLVMLPGGHFDPYDAQFEAATRAAVGWFTAHL